MARPRKDSEERGAEARMIEAFWDQLSRMPYREVTAASIARQAECNRATTMEALAVSWLAESGFGESVGVRFDKIGLVVVGEDRALLRHHINAFGEA